MGNRDNNTADQSHRHRVTLEPAIGMVTHGLIDFEGDYGADYDRLIRIVIAGYELMHELGVAAARASCPQAQALLIVGPAWGEELPLWNQAYPQAHFTLVEPSVAMATRCQQQLEALGLGERSQLLPCRLEQSQLSPRSFDVVVAQLVLHLLPAGPQGDLAEQLAGLVRPGGLLLFSGSGSHGDPQLDDLLLATWRERLRLQGVDEALIDRFAAARGREVFAIDPRDLAPRLLATGCTEPWALFQGGHVGLWCSRRGPNNAH